MKRRNGSKELRKKRIKSQECRKSWTLAGVALCRLRPWPERLLPFLWVTDADNRSSSGTAFSCWGLWDLWWRCGGELPLVWPPVSDILACPDDRFSSEELLPVHSGRLYKSQQSSLQQVRLAVRRRAPASVWQFSNDVRSSSVFLSQTLHRKHATILSSTRGRRQ